jgi:hypothetical protein
MAPAGSTITPLAAALATVVSGALAAQASSQYVVPPANLKAALYAPWAHSHWVWLDGDTDNQVRAAGVRLRSISSPMICRGGDACPPERGSCA